MIAAFMNASRWSEDALQATILLSLVTKHGQKWSALRLDIKGGGRVALARNWKSFLALTGAQGIRTVQPPGVSLYAAQPAYLMGSGSLLELLAAYDDTRFD